MRLSEVTAVTYRTTLRAFDGRPPIHHGSNPVDYSTDVIGEEAIHWLRSLGSDSPFLLFVAPYAPLARHDPVTC